MNADDGPGERPPTVRAVERGRATARERALHLLYESAIKDLTPTEVLNSQMVAVDPYSEALVLGVESERAVLDGLIDELAGPGWSLPRMAALDLTIMRMACFELSHRPDVPTGVVLAEAVRLAEDYGTDDSPRFVNGLLAAAAERLRPERQGL